MRKLAVIVIALFIGGFTIQAQKKERPEQMTIAQQTDLAVKAMTLKLDLTESQQKQIAPLLAKQITKKEERKANFKANKNGQHTEKLTADARYEQKKAYLEEKIAFKNEMKRILNADQFEKFEKHISEKKGRKGEKNMKKKQRKA